MLDSDDLWSPTYLKTMGGVLAANPRAALAYTDAWIFDEAKGEGYDVKILKEIIKIRKQDKKERDEHETLLDVYMNAIETAGPLSPCLMVWNGAATLSWIALPPMVSVSGSTLWSISGSTSLPLASR